MSDGLNMTMNIGHLIEPTVKYYLFNTLQSCHTNRVNVYYYVLNIGVFLLFTGITGYILYYCYTHKLSPQEKQQRMLRDQNVVLSKIRMYQEDMQDRRMSDITNLPVLER
jgi:hypothetical protein